MPKSVAPTQGNITHTLHLKVSTGPPLLRGIHRLGNSDLVSRAPDTGSLTASNGNHDMMAQVDFASTVLAAKTLAFDTNILFHDVESACTSSGTVSVV